MIDTMYNEDLEVTQDVVMEIVEVKEDPAWHKMALAAVREILFFTRWDFKLRQVRVPYSIPPDLDTEMHVFREYGYLVFHLVYIADDVWNRNVPYKDGISEFKFDPGIVEEFLEKFYIDDIRRMGWL